MKIIDLSFDIENGMPTCGTSWHQIVELKQLGTIETVGRNTHSVMLGSHTGTHMDAPLHFMENGKTIDMVDLSSVCGEIQIVDFAEVEQNQCVTLSMVKDLKVTERMLFRFNWFKKWKTNGYYLNFPFFSEDAVDYLIDNGMKLMALDTPSPDSGSNINSKDDSPNHKKMLRNNIVIIEYLNNTDLLNVNSNYTIFALPLKLKGVDGSPCRVIIVENI